MPDDRSNLPASESPDIELMDGGAAPPPSAGELAQKRRLPLSANAAGALYILASALGFTITGLMVKGLGDAYSAALQNFFRQVAGLLVILPIVVRMRRAAFASSQPGLLVFRGVAITLAATLQFYAFQKMPLGEANALSFTRALWMVPLAILFVGERVGPARIIATLVGFVGVLVMIRPNHGFALDLPSLAMLASALLFACTAISIRVIGASTSTATLLVWSTLLGVLFSVPGAVLTWKTPTWPDLLLLSVMGIISTGSQAFYIKGMSIGDPSAMGPVDYSRLVFATIGAFLLFHEVPTPIGMIGAAIVIISTLAVSRDWSRKKRPA